MPKQRALRQFKAALFETLSHPVRIALMKQLTSGEVEAQALVNSLNSIAQGEAADHLSVLVGNRIVTRRFEDGRIYYGLNDPSLGLVTNLLQGGTAWSVALAHAVRIEILEFLSEGEHEQEELIEKIEREERPEAVGHLQALVNVKLVARRTEGGRTFYSVIGGVVPQVLMLLREYFETHLVEALMMVSQMSFRHIEEEAQQLKTRLATGGIQDSSW